MPRTLNLELIFPMRDEPSARLMSLKARCLQRAGMISKRDKQAVLGRAKAVTAAYGRADVRRHGESHALVA